MCALLDQADVHSCQSSGCKSEHEDLEWVACCCLLFIHNTWLLFHQFDFFASFISFLKASSCWQSSQMQFCCLIDRRVKLPTLQLQHVTRAFLCHWLSLYKVGHNWWLTADRTVLFLNSLVRDTLVLRSELCYRFGFFTLLNLRIYFLLSKGCSIPVFLIYCPEAEGGEGKTKVNRYLSASGWLKAPDLNICFCFFKTSISEPGPVSHSISVKDVLKPQLMIVLHWEMSLSLSKLTAKLIYEKRGRNRPTKTQNTIMKFW